MEKDIGKIKKNEITDIVVRIDDFGGKVGLTIREFTTSERYTGFTKSGTRIPAEFFAEFKQMINSVDESELMAGAQQTENKKSANKKQQKLSDVSGTSKENIEEEVF